MTDLATQRCQPIDKSTPALGEDQVQQLLAQLPGWQRRGDEIVKIFNFENYYETMAFVNATAWISHREDHHPELQVGYNKCTVRYSTHSVGGLSRNDFICSAKIERLMAL